MPKSQTAKITNAMCCFLFFFLLIYNSICWSFDCWLDCKFKITLGSDCDQLNKNIINWLIMKIMRLQLSSFMHPFCSCWALHNSTAAAMTWKPSLWCDERNNIFTNYIQNWPLKATSTPINYVLLLPVCTWRGSDRLLLLLRCLLISSTPSDSSMCSSALAAPFRFSQLSLSSAPARPTQCLSHKNKRNQLL